MKNNEHIVKPCLLFIVAAIGMAPVSAPRAQATGKSAYLTDTRGDVVRNATYLCWHTGYWTPAAAIAECDPDLVPRPVSNPAPVVVPPPPVAQAPAPRPAPPPPPVPAMEKVTIAAETLFDFDKAVVKPEGRKRLDDLVASIAAVNLEIIIAVGHTDSIGSDAYNQKLSLRRAEAVKAHLVGKGVSPDRVSTDGKGERQPVADNKTREGRAKNRRVEIEVIGTRQGRR